MEEESYISKLKFQEEKEGEEEKTQPYSQGIKKEIHAREIQTPLSLVYSRAGNMLYKHTARCRNYPGQYRDSIITKTYSFGFPNGGADRLLPYVLQPLPAGTPGAPPEGRVWRIHNFHIKTDLKLNYRWLTKLTGANARRYTPYKYNVLGLDRENTIHHTFLVKVRHVIIYWRLPGMPADTDVFEFAPEAEIRDPLGQIPIPEWNDDQTQVGYNRTNFPESFDVLKDKTYVYDYSKSPTVSWEDYIVTETLPNDRIRGLGSLNPNRNSNRYIQYLIWSDINNGWSMWYWYSQQGMNWIPTQSPYFKPLQCSQYVTTYYSGRR